MKNYLESFHLFTDQEIAEVLELGTYKTLDKGDYFFREGSVCKQVAFVFSGIFRHFYYSDTGEEISYCFTFEDNFLTAYSSFIAEKPTNENIQALTNAKLFVIPKTEMDRLINTHQSWNVFARKIADRQYIKRENRIFLLQKESAKIKYEALLQTTPEYLQNVPLQYLASYLGMTQRHLSRLRRELSF